MSGLSPGIIAYYRRATEEAVRRLAEAGAVESIGDSKGDDTMLNLKDLVLDFVLRVEFDPKDAATFVESFATATSKGLNPKQAALYALLDAHSEELSRNEQFACAVDMEGMYEESRQHCLQTIFCEVARKF